MRRDKELRLRRAESSRYFRTAVADGQQNCGQCSMMEQKVDGTLGGRRFGAFEIELSVRVDLSFTRILREHAAREAVQIKQRTVSL